MRYLITGGCGFIGRNLILRLKSNPENQIRVFDDLSVGSAEELRMIVPVLARGENEEPRFVDGAAELVVGDIRDVGEIKAAMAGAEIVVHLAANSGVALAVADPERDCSVNVLGTLNCLQAARFCGVRRFVFASSGAPLGMCEPPLHEAMAPRPASPYGASKLAGEAYCCAFFHCFGLETVVLRFANVYGPHSGHKTSVVAKLIREALRGETWTLYGDGQQTRDFIFIDDLCSAISKAAMTADIGGEVFQIATNSETSVLDLADRLRGALRGCGIESPPSILGTMPRGDVRRNFSNIEKAASRLGWRPLVDLDAGLAMTLDWFLQQGAEPA